MMKTLFNAQERQEIRDLRKALHKLRVKAYNHRLPTIAASQQCDLEASRTLFSLALRKNPSRLYNQNRLDRLIGVMID